MQFHRNSGTFEAGDRIRVADWKPGDRFRQAPRISLSTLRKAIELAAGRRYPHHRQRARRKDRRHKLNNGAIYRVEGFTGRTTLSSTTAGSSRKDFGHLAYGYVTTSHASQGKTVDRVLIAMGQRIAPSDQRRAVVCLSQPRSREGHDLFRHVAGRAA